jgi:hypothetical protein
VTRIASLFWGIPVLGIGSDLAVRIVRLSSGQ